ncbi:hypothetical protein C3486_32075 [Streptomyces sp. Ru73]|uniref:hypothetical protein n=1 Tax=Streptomyces sp. Ru73 TaxID=2080748 RepID=UPI000CDCF8D0|nr:hypothetical protein [Streptomyces sp. Ru73]POX36736.1 hypothetical protein C3486_32075 [Streptomyces sp. Ru73]
MEQSTAVSPMSPVAGRAPAFRWALSARRRPGSDKEATVLAGAVLDALGAAGEGAASVVADLARATAYVLAHGSADGYRLTIEVDGGQCAVRVDDRDADGRDACRAAEEPAGEEPVPAPGDAGAGGRLRVQRRTDGTLAVTFRRPFPVVGELASAAAPDRTAAAPERAGAGPEPDGAGSVVPLPVAARGMAAEPVVRDLVAEG